METTAAAKIKSYGDFGSQPQNERTSFPQFITSMKNGKYLFYPQSFTLSDSSEKILLIDVEEWQLQNDWNWTANNFPGNFTGDRNNYWIFKI